MLSLPLFLGLHLGAALPAPSTGFPSSAPRVSSSADVAARLLPSGGQCAVLAMANPSAGDLSQDGIVSLTGSEIAAAIGSASGVDFRRVAIAAGSRGPLPDWTDSVFEEGGLAVIPIRRVDLDGDGVLDPGDRIEFFAHGPSFWEPHPAWPDSLLELNVHPWDLERRYLLRLDAPVGSPDLPVASRSGSLPAFSSTLLPVWAGKHLQLRSSDTDTLFSGREWYWTMAEGKGLSSTSLAHPATTNLAGFAGGPSVAVVRLALDYPGPRDTFSTTSAVSRLLGVSGHQSAWALSGLRATGNSYRWVQGSKQAERFESYTIHFPHAPSLTAAVPFPAPRAGTFQMPVQGSGPADTMVAVEDGVARRLIALDGGLLRDSASSRNTWYHPLRSPEPSVRLLAWKAPTGKQVAPPEEFARTFDRDLVVVAPDSFLDVASQFATFRADPKRTRPFSTTILRTEDVWMLHGNGSRDPLALRAAFAQARARWGTSHAMILGGGHVDSRGILGTGLPPIPIWTKNGEASDAILQYLDPGEWSRSNKAQDLALGRVPARSRREAGDWLRKLRTFEDPSLASSGLWRNTFLATADDLQVRGGTGLDSGFLEGGSHTSSSERIVESVLQARPWTNVRKVYLVQFPSNQNLEKPEAQTVLVEELGRGAVAFNYMGHGASDILADERLLDTRSAITRLRNANTPFLFFAGSCTVGRHDMPDARGLSEAMVVADRLGAFAAVSGTRVSSGPSNETLARNFWSSLFRTTPSGLPTTIGEALMWSGNLSDRSNSDIYNLLGDPSMAPFPAGSPLTLDAAPKSVSALDTLRLTGQALAKVRITLQTRPTTQVSTFLHRSATKYKVADSALLQKVGERTYVEEFQAPGRSLLSVSSAASSGSYSTLLRIPTRIPFGDTATLSIYAWDPTTLRDSGAIVEGIPLAGVTDRLSDDVSGPVIRVLPCDSSWSGGHPFGRRAEIPSPFCLNIAFEDSSGISTSDAPDEGIILSIPGTRDPWHPEEVVEGLEFSQVWTRLVLDPETFKPGRTYPLRVFARDLMGNASSSSVELRIRAPGEIDLYEVFNRPNPVKGDATTFHFKLLGDADSNGTVPQTIQASIRIHTLSGKLVRVLRTDLAEVGQPRPRAVWDLKDGFRNDVANGLYPYVVRLRVKNPEGGNWREIERRGIVAVSR